jgi:hypothetical protein
MDLLRYKEKRLLEETSPWDRCMRFEFRTTACDEEDTMGLPCLPNIMTELLQVTTNAFVKSSMPYWANFGTDPSL